jgi:hypothetical protein
MEALRSWNGSTTVGERGAMAAVGKQPNSEKPPIKRENGQFPVSKRKFRV